VGGATGAANRTAVDEANRAAVGITVGGAVDKAVDPANRTAVGTAVDTANHATIEAVGVDSWCSCWRGEQCSNWSGV
jgi:hypothetical protein